MQDSPQVLEWFHQHLDLVNVAARALSHISDYLVEMDDLVSFGREGLLDAARRFDPERGVPFRGYAKIRVRGAIIDGMRKGARLPRRVHEKLSAARAANEFSSGALEDMTSPAARSREPARADAKLAEHLAGMATAMALGLVSEPTLDGEHQQAGHCDPEQSAVARELHAILVRGIADLPAEEAELLRRHYFDGDRFDHIARDLGVSKSWASRLHTRAIGRLTRRLKELT